MMKAEPIRLIPQKHTANVELNGFQLKFTRRVPSGRLKSQCAL